MLTDRVSVFLVLLLAAAGVSGHSHALRTPVNPTLHQGNLRKDYPVDGDPNAGTKFKHPFPSVQDTDKYEYDFVKDEHKDNGEFKAQSEYDRLRAKVAKEREAAQKLKDKAFAEDAEYRNAVKAEEEAEAKAKAAREEAEEAKKKADAANDAADTLDGKKTSDGKDKPMPGSGPAYTIPEAKTGVDKASSHLEDCKQQLKDAEKNLESVMARKEAEKRMEQEAAGANATKAGIHNKVLSDEEQHALAVKRYDQELKDVDKAENQLKEAAARLAAFRSGNASDGKSSSLYATAGKSGAVGSSVPSVLALLMMVVASMAMAFA